MNKKNSITIRRGMKVGLLIPILFPAFVLAQAVQPCVVKQYNQKDAKTPLAGVQVEVRGAGTEVSDEQGLLTLNFTTLKPGDRVVIRGIVKNGYEVFNTSEVEQWTISRDQTPFQIVMVRSDYMMQLKHTLRENSLENYKLKYEQTKKQLKKEQEAGRLKDEEYRREVEKLEEQYDNYLMNLDNNIDKFAHFDLNEASTEEQRILDMVQQGQIDKAVKAYKELHLNEKFLQERVDFTKLDGASASFEKEKFQQLLDAVENAIILFPDNPDFYHTKGEILLMSGNEKGALEMWRKVVEIDPDFLKHLEEDGSASDLYKELKDKGLVE